MKNGPLSYQKQKMRHAMAGHCVACRTPPVRERVRCETHLQVQRIADIKRRPSRTKTLCGTCGQRGHHRQRCQAIRENGKKIQD
jgi:hypothetical protein